MAEPLKTTGNLLDALALRMNQKLGSPPLLMTEAEATGLANEAYYLVVLKKGLLVSKYQFNFLATWSEYSLSSATNIIGIKMVTFNNLGKPLIRTEKEFVMTDNPTAWNATVGNPTEFYLTDPLFTSIGFNKYPADTSKTCEVYYIYRPAYLEATAKDTVLVTPYEYNLAIVAWMHFWARVKRQDKDALEMAKLGKPAPEFWAIINEVGADFDAVSNRQIEMRPAGQEIDIYHT